MPALLIEKPYTPVGIAVRETELPSWSWTCQKQHSSYSIYGEAEDLNEKAAKRERMSLQTENLRRSSAF